MNLEFKSAYLVCMERQDDINYVVARSFSMKKAEELAEQAKNKWPKEEIYISIEKIAVDDPLKHLQLEAANPIKKNNSDVCICGKNPGGCIGSLSCKCSAIASCKRVTEENPLDFENYNYQKTPTLETARVEVIGVKRGIFEVRVPDWDPDEVIGLSPNEISSELKRSLTPGLLLLAEVNLEANKVSDLIFENLRIDEQQEIQEDEETEETEEEENLFEEQLEEGLDETLESEDLESDS